jgi:hypothetical protein
MDEIMIVNPGHEGLGLVLRADGLLYKAPLVAPKKRRRSIIDLFLGDDGRIYEASGEGGIGHLYLGEDGTLYELVR